VGTNTTQVATTALVQAEIANKRAWSTWVPTITSQSGTYTSIAATLARYVVIYGICYFQLKIKVTTKGTGVMPTFTLPFTALTGTDLMSFPAQEGFNNAIGGTAQVATDLAHAIIRNYAAGDLVTADGAIVTVQGFYPIA
jgi:dihydrodipicolinate synthase/N-acetylneuraminate lyase